MRHSQTTVKTNQIKSKGEISISLQSEVGRAIRGISSLIQERRWAELPPQVLLLSGREVPVKFERTIATLALKVESTPAFVKTVQICHRLSPQKDFSPPIDELPFTEELEIICADRCVCSLIRPIRITFERKERGLQVSRIAYDPNSSQPTIGPIVGAPLLVRLEQLLETIENEANARSSLPNSLATRLKALDLRGLITFGFDHSTGKLPQFTHINWAVAEALKSWNAVALGFAEARMALRSEKPDIIVRASLGPVFAGRRAVFIASAFNRSVRRSARIGSIMLSASHSKSPTSLWLSPEELRYNLEHEIGHVLGIDDCAHTGRIMHSFQFGVPWPRPGNVERWSLQRLNRTLNRVSELLRMNTLSNGETQPCITAFVPRAPETAAPRVLEKPADFSVGTESTWMKLIWDGERQLRLGSVQLAERLFEEAAKLATDPAEAHARLGMLKVYFLREAKLGVDMLETVTTDSLHTSTLSYPALFLAALGHGYTVLGDHKLANIALARRNSWLTHEQLCYDAAVRRITAQSGLTGESYEGSASDALPETF